MDPVSGELLFQIAVLVTQIRIHINIKDISPVGQCRDRLISLHNRSVIVDLILAAHLLRNMHDALNIDDRIRLKLIDFRDHITKFVVIVLGIGNSQFIDTDRNINLAKLLFGKKSLDRTLFCFISLFCIIELLVIIEKVIDRDRFLGKERRHISHIAVFIQTYRTGISDHKRVRKVRIVHLLQTVIGTVCGKKALCIRVIDGVVRGQIFFIGYAVILGGNDLAAGCVRHLEGLCGRPCFGFLLCLRHSLRLGFRPGPGFFRGLGLRLCILCRLRLRSFDGLILRCAACRRFCCGRLLRSTLAGCLSAVSVGIRTMRSRPGIDMVMDPAHDNRQPRELSMFS